MKKTTAIIGDKGDIISALAEVLLNQDLRLLFVCENEAKKLEIKRQLKDLNVTGEVEFLSCERDGCWEADMIVLTNPDTSSTSLVEKIKEVATQKIVMVVSDAGIKEKPDLQELLPCSKVVEIRLDINGKEVSLYSNNAEAIVEVQKFFEASSYQLK